MLFSKVINVGRVMATKRTSKHKKSTYPNTYQHNSQPTDKHENTDAINQIDQSLFLLRDINFESTQEPTLSVIKKILETLHQCQIELLSNKTKEIKELEKALKKIMDTKDLPIPNKLNVVLHKLETTLKIEIAKYYSYHIQYDS